MNDTQPHPQADILVVDDAPVNVRFLVKTLSAHGYTVRPALDGVLALAAAQKKPPDLILLDINMPDLNGYQVCEQLKADDQTCDIPIIFISALEDVLDKVKAFSVGGVDYVTKPFQVEEVLARIQTHLTIRNLQKQLQHSNAQLRTRNSELQEALDTIKTISGIVPICAWCGRKIRGESGEWIRIEIYLEENTDAEFTHGMCPDCGKKMHSRLDHLQS